ncbi:EpsD family peptidyl-prolyl cis-trans isomerase [Scleromatobacter humisilvae]|uniref:EpsD family peptidyl-prolyl cis-trans isomerase n=1 Tax=Scleromatobacter humisilvae TaxID=2897159 RepID=A0A9X2C1K8_9BURK|nr:EpsD family peptidyl-prolyl cis-trans isomerase [Scleromatobacter humisilvae]MCK9685879.1 EpsD family peptidyl-prolyl cis-trans isomerase [Scleromatobacter humisilvae]
MAATLLAACGQKKDVAPADTAGSEAVAKVNGDELTANQLSIALLKQRGMRPDAGDAQAKQVLDQLIDEQIVAQKAVAAKLDQDPKVVAQIEAARRDILARRFLEAAAETAAKPASDAVQKFYDSRPALFAQRKVYTLQRIDIQAPDDRRTEVDAHVQSLKTSAELTDWLKSQKLQFTTKQEQDAAEQLPPLVLDKVAAIKEGQSIVVPSQFGVSALTLVSSASAPKSLADAGAAIEQFLGNQGRREVIMNLQKTIRDGAKVEYQGRFAALAAATGDGASPASAPSLSVAPAASNAAPSASQNSSTKK